MVPPHRILAALAVVALLLAGCTAAPPGGGNATLPEGDGVGAPPTGPPPGSGSNASGLPPAFNATGEGFAWDLVRALRAEKPASNLFLSPVSVAAALCLALEGSAGTTREALAATLGLGAAAEQDCRDLVQALLRARNASGAQVDVANSVWLRDTFAPSVQPAFLDAVRAEYRAGAFVRPFDDATVDELNAWVGNATRGMIPHILDELADDLVFLLVNAVYFDGRWGEPFDANLTEPRDFRLADGRTVQVPTMSHLARNVSLGAGEGFRVARIPYADGAHAMFVLLPDEGRALDDVAAQLSDEAWAGLLAGMRREQEVDLALPKFQLEWEAELEAVLTALGMGVAFDPSAADFGRIADVAPERLYISFVKHKAALEVDEEGTKASAATVVGGSLTSLPPPPPVFHVDRPFLLGIVDEQLGMPLFVGAVENPAAA